MRRFASAIFGIAIITLAGCGKVPPAAFQAVAGQGAKVARKAVAGEMPKAARVAPKAAAGAVPKAAQPARESGLGKKFVEELTQEAAQRALDEVLKRIQKDDSRKR